MELSVVNLTSETIRDIRLIAIFYERRDEAQRYPMHYKLIKISGPIPPGLGFAEKLANDKKLQGHEMPYGWETKVKVLDYEIDATNNIGIPVFD